MSRLRFASWMTTCPVLLIHLNNLAGEEVQNVERASMLVIELNLMVLLGATSSFTDGGGALVGTRRRRHTYDDTHTHTHNRSKTHTHARARVYSQAAKQRSAYTTAA